MYSVNDTIIYGMDGVCKISEVAEQVIDGKRRDYYVLKPVHDGYSTLFIPVDCEKSLAKMRSVLSLDEIKALICEMENEETVWIDDDNQRKAQFKEIVANGDRKALIRVIKSMYLHKQSQHESGKKLHSVDERIMKDAEKMLYDEFAYVLGIERDEVLDFIIEKIES